MDEKFQIILYIAFGLVWIFTTINKANKEKRKKQQATEPLMPLPTEEDIADEQRTALDEFERAIKDIRQSERISSDIGKPIDVALTRDPYKESIEFTARKKRRREAEAIAIAEEERNDTIEIEEIDWKKAVIYSEILRPKF